MQHRGQAGFAVLPPSVERWGGSFLHETRFGTPLSESGTLMRLWTHLGGIHKKKPLACRSVMDVLERCFV